MTTERLVRVATFSSEPLARLWEQTLSEEGIPCVARALSGGHGVLGPVPSLPYGLYVQADDEDRARYLLGRSAEPEDYASEPVKWSIWYWPPFVRVMAFFLLLIFLGAVLVQLYLSIAR